MSQSSPSPLQRLRARLPNNGQVQWIGLRPGRDQPMHNVDLALAVPGKGLQGDRYRGSRGVREISLIQAEYLPVISSLSLIEELAPEILRRNVLVSGISLQALIGRRMQIGEVVLEGTGHCHPCSRMETALGPGGYNAMRGHGGITARVLTGGEIRVGDAVVALDQYDD